VSRGAAWLRVVRAPLAPTAALDAVGCALLASTAAGASPDPSLLRWAGLAASSLLVYAFGMAANDFADRTRDRTLAPNRPLPSGELSPRAVAAALVLFAAGALAIGGGSPERRPLVAAALAAAAAYDFLLKRRFLPGAVAMGSVRALNAATAVLPGVLAGEIPGVALLAPVAVGLYAAAVNVLSTTEDFPFPHRKVASHVMAATAFATMGTAAWLAVGGPAPGSLLALVLTGAAASSTVMGRTPRPGPPKAQVREMLLGLYWLSGAAAATGDGGSWPFAAGAFAVAIALVLGSQLAMRALARR
jgi:4-hydroxybenzoate polyprenyltransferase